MISNAKNRSLNSQSPGLPNMSSTLDGWLQKLKLYIVSTTVEAFQTVEQRQEVSFLGVWQPMSVSQIERKPKEWREFHWYMLHSKTDLELKFKDRIEYKGNNYKVLTVGPYDDYGYFYYELVEDFKGIGPYDQES